MANAKPAGPTQVIMPLRPAPNPKAGFVCISLGSGIVIAHVDVCGAGSDASTRMTAQRAIHSGWVELLREPSGEYVLIVKSSRVRVSLVFQEPEQA